MIAFIAVQTASSQQQEQQHQCGIDTEDGTCSDESSSCVDNHEQCDEWMTEGEPRVVMDSIISTYSSALLENTQKLTGKFRSYMQANAMQIQHLC
jgi:hypothetical protein